MTRVAPSVPFAARLTAGAVGLAAVGLLSGCAAQATAPAASAPAAQPAGDASSSAASSSASSSSSSAASSSGASSSGASSSGYTDGTFTQTAPYQTPGGQETVTVTATLKSGTVTAVKVTGSESTPNAKHYVEAFAGGVGGQVVGKKIADLKVGAIAGSSLTPKGFNAAVAKIAAAAKA
ncbi:FMN-binding protein [uncultured Amnibacterium sp.]|uniref:FMN-binding protein n=1 Tax=uncultured Amnibacterium sp. TaxID=1631851 RepID=UPI0035CA050A